MAYTWAIYFGATNTFVFAQRLNKVNALLSRHVVLFPFTPLFRFYLCVIIHQPPSHPYIQPSTHSSIHRHTHSPFHPSICPYTHPTARPTIYSLIHSFSHPLDRAPIHQFPHQPTHPSVHSPIHPCCTDHFRDSYGGLDVRRKNATRESTSTLKAWLYEHIKNPYPTKGEKIMLAIITKMTLTQVSTWFANARRRLKKENKMQWSPRNRSGDDDDDKATSDDDGQNNGDNDGDGRSGGTLGEGGKKGDDEDVVVDTGELSSLFSASFVLSLSLCSAYYVYAVVSLVIQSVSRLSRSSSPLIHYATRFTFPFQPVSCVCILFKLIHKITV